MNAIARFERSVEPELNTGCLLWAGSRVNDTYGSIRVRGRQRLTHRVAWEIARGPIPDGAIVCHKCDTPACVNPDHLFLGTHKTNSDDKYAKGRANVLRGERNGRAKLSAADVVDIRRQYAAGGVSQQAIADRYGVTQNMISKIVTRRFWQDLP